MGVKVKPIVKGIIFDDRRKRVLLLKRSECEDTGVGTWENAVYGIIGRWYSGGFSQKWCFR